MVVRNVDPHEPLVPAEPRELTFGIVARRLLHALQRRDRVGIPVEIVDHLDVAHGMQGLRVR